MRYLEFIFENNIQAHLCIIQVPLWCGSCLSAGRQLLPHPPEAHTPVQLTCCCFPNTSRSHGPTFWHMLHRLYGIFTNQPNLRSSFNGDARLPRRPSLIPHTQVITCGHLPCVGALFPLLSYTWALWTLCDSSLLPHYIPSAYAEQVLGNSWGNKLKWSVSSVLRLLTTALDKIIRNRKARFLHHALC